LSGERAKGKFRERRGTSADSFRFFRPSVRHGKRETRKIEEGLTRGKAYFFRANKGFAPLSW